MCFFFNIGAAYNVQKNKNKDFFYNSKKTFYHTKNNFFNENGVPGPFLA